MVKNTRREFLLASVWMSATGDEAEAQRSAVSEAEAAAERRASSARRKREVSAIFL